MRDITSYFLFAFFFKPGDLAVLTYGAGFWGSILSSFFFTAAYLESLARLTPGMPALATAHATLSPFAGTSAGIKSVSSAVR